MKLKMQENEAVITITDHKEGFPHHVPYRVLNPLKSNTGKISEALIGKIDSAVLSNAKVNQGKIHLPSLHGSRGAGLTSCGEGALVMVS